MTAPTTTVLDAAREHLRQRAIAADNAGDWKASRLLSPLHDAADMVCRVGDNDHSRHYQADKAGDLVYAALRLRRGAFERYGGFLDDSDPLSPINDITDLVSEVEQSIEAVLWIIARRHAEREDGRRVADTSVPEYTARELRARIERLAQWARQLETFEDDE